MISECPIIFSAFSFRSVILSLTLVFMFSQLSCPCGVQLQLKAACTNDGASFVPWYGPIKFRIHCFVHLADIFMLSTKLPSTLLLASTFMAVSVTYLFSISVLTFFICCAFGLHDSEIQGDVHG